MLLSTGKLAKLADSVGICTYGDTTVLSTAISQYTPDNLSSDLKFDVYHRFKDGAIGEIPVMTNMRGTRTAHNITRLRLSLLPLFPAHYKRDTSLTCNILAVHDIEDLSPTCINAASLALAASNIPWDGPVGAVR